MNKMKLGSNRGYRIAEGIDLQVEIEPVPFDVMAQTTPAESSAVIRERVMRARAIQLERYKNLPGIHSNAQMNSRLLHEYAWPDAEGLAKLKERMEKLNMSARAFDRILRVARTIADLDYAASLPAQTDPAYRDALQAAANAPVLTRHLAEAIGYRSLDRASYGRIF